MTLKGILLNKRMKTQKSTFYSVPFDEWDTFMYDCTYIMFRKSELICVDRSQNRVYWRRGEN